MMYGTRLKLYHIIGAIFAVMVGTRMHFVYNRSGGDMPVGIFAPVNESVWEHFKMLFWPVLFFNLVEYCLYGCKLNHFIPVKVLSLFWGMLTIPLLHDFFTFLTGRHYLISDIFIFMISLAVAFVLSL